MSCASAHRRPMVWRTHGQQEAPEQELTIEEEM